MFAYAAKNPEKGAKIKSMAFPERGKPSAEDVFVEVFEPAKDEK
jgi:hypothetical protein